MKLTIKIKHLVILIIVAGILICAGLTASAEGPSAYIRYDSNGTNVVASVYWDDTNEYSFEWADSMNASGSDLEWKTTGVSRENETETDNYVTINLNKYKNYYFKIAKNSDVTILRSYPSDINNAVNPTRKQNDYAHGNFTPDTTMCGICHSTHSSLKGQLLKQATYYDLCMLCHSNSNSQSKYDVEMGLISMGEDRWAESMAGPIGIGVASSGHDVNDKFNTTVRVPGSNPDPSKVLTFTCISCHTAHGGKDDNYRLIRKKIYPSNDSWRERIVKFSAYATVQNRTVDGESISEETASFVSGNTEFCTACHLDYDKGDAINSGGEYDIYRRHPVTVGSVVYSVAPRNLFPISGDNLPLQYHSSEETTDKRTAVVCQTCHFAHGTRKSFVISGSETSGKNMLRLDNYGVCESCHKM